MYHAKAQHPLSSPLPTLPPAVEESMWQLFLAIGPAWRFDDDAQAYHIRFHTFLQNRLALYPYYATFYQTMTDLIANLAAQKDLAAAYQVIFFNNNPYNLQYSQETMQLMQTYVVFEFINFRLACGSFKAWGARNFCTYFGGANLEGEPVPYRPAEGLDK